MPDLKYSAMPFAPAINNSTTLSHLLHPSLPCRSNLSTDKGCMFTVFQKCKTLLILCAYRSDTPHVVVSESSFPPCLLVISLSGLFMFCGYDLHLSFFAHRPVVSSSEVKVQYYKQHTIHFHYVLICDFACMALHLKFISFSCPKHKSKGALQNGTKYASKGVMTKVHASNLKFDTFRAHKHFVPSVDKYTVEYCWIHMPAVYGKYIFCLRKDECFFQ